MTVRAGARVVALAVQDVLSVRELPAASLQELPPLLGDSGAQAVASLGRLDAELLLVLGAVRLVAPEVWHAIDVWERSQ